MQKPNSVSRLVLPVVWHHIKSRNPVTGEARATLQELCRVLLEYMGPSFVNSSSHLSVENQKKFEELLDNIR